MVLGGVGERGATELRYQLRVYGKIDLPRSAISLRLQYMQRNSFNNYLKLANCKDIIWIFKVLAMK